MTIKIDLYTANVCPRCVATKKQLSAAIEQQGKEHFELNFKDVVEHIDQAVKLGILATPAIVINNKLVFTSSPSDKKLKTLLKSYLI